MNIVLAGGTGFIGKKLTDDLLAHGHRVVLLTRKAAQDRPGTLTQVEWDGKNQGRWSAFVDGADAVINLCGEPVAARPWTKEEKQKIVSSRVESTRAIVQAVQKAQKKPALFMNASGTGFYGDRGEEMITESAGPGIGFLADTCVQWESEAAQAENPETRVILLRLGAVLEKNGGMLAKVIPPFQFFMGGPIGPGTQWLPWIHREDAAGLIVHLLNAPEVQGPVNCTAPEPIIMKHFCAALGRTLHRPSWLPVPSFAVRIMAGEMSEMVLSSQRVIPAKLMRSGYQFKYPVVEKALAAILEGKP